MKKKTFDFYKIIPMIIIIFSCGAIGYNVINSYQYTYNPGDYRYDELGFDYEKEIREWRNSKVDINTATAKELCELPGIGEILSERIIETRENIGGFSSAEEIGFVEGIGEERAAELLPYITAGEETSENK